MIDFKRELPEYVEYKGINYGIKTDFRVWINLEEIFYSDMPWIKKAVEIFSLCYINSLPPNAEIAMHLLINFYCGGAVDKKEKNRLKRENSKIYDFKEDAELFYAAFMQQYGIDLMKENLHWWKFLALFRSLTQDTKLFDVMQIRAMDLSDITERQEKNYYRKLKRIYRLPNKYLSANDEKLAETVSQMML